MNEMRVLVCGSRSFEDQNIVSAVLDGLYEEFTVGHLVAYVAKFVIIEGGAPGADSLAGWWARNSPMHSYNENGDVPEFEHLRFPADWDRHGKAAGPIRNQQMLDEGKPTYVVAFTDKPLEESRGTHDMTRKARSAGLPVYLVQHLG